jgi:uracil-DNA glycosylase
MDKAVLQLQAEISRCQICLPHLEFGVNPVVSFSEKSRILVIGQAPGSIVHSTGVPWNDKSGDNLRAWLGVDEETFYNPDNFGIVPMGFCYPGKGKSGDLPPRK